MLLGKTSMGTTRDHSTNQFDISIKLSANYPLVLTRACMRERGKENNFLIHLFHKNKTVKPRGEVWGGGGGGGEKEGTNLTFLMMSPTTPSPDPDKLGLGPSSSCTRVVYVRFPFFL